MRTYEIQVMGQIPDSEGIGYWSTLRAFNAGDYRDEISTLKAAREYAERARKTLRYVMLWLDGKEVR
jgi:hypothetical protein